MIAPLLFAASISLASCPSIYSLPDASAPIEERIRCAEERQRQLDEERRASDPASPFREWLPPVAPESRDPAKR